MKKQASIIGNKTVKIFYSILISSLFFIPFLAFASTVDISGTVMTNNAVSNAKVFDYNAVSTATRLIKLFFGDSYDTVGRSETEYAVFDGAHCGDGDDYGTCISRLSEGGTAELLVYKFPDGTLSYTPYVPPPPAGINPIIDYATSTFASSTGVELTGTTGVTGFMSNAIKLVIGSGAALLVSLLPWTLAMLIIGGIVYFLYRAFIFFRH